MKNLLMPFLLSFLLVGLAPLSHAQPIESPLLENFVGEWRMVGQIGGQAIHHDVSCDWILEKNYLRFHEIARELDANGRPAYEASVTLGWDAETERFACLWLDTTGGGGLSNGIIGYAVQDGNRLPFIFDMGEGSRIHNTFTWRPETKAWDWRIDMENGGVLSNFSEVTLKQQ